MLSNTGTRRLSSVIRGVLAASVVVVGGQVPEVLAQAAAPSNIEEIVVTARRRAESLQEVPLSINAFSSETISEAGISDMSGIAAFTPGFDFAQAFGRQDFRPAIRGQSTIQGGANAGLFIDGFFVGEGGATLPLTAVDRVEVVKGPQGALYGRSTLAGAVNYVLKKPTDKFQGDATLTAGEYGELRGDVTLRGPMTDTIGYMISAGYYTYDGQYKNGFEGNGAGAPARHDTIGAQETKSLAATLSFKPSDAFDAAFTVLLERSDDGPYAIGLLSASHNNCAFGPAPTPPPGTPGYGTLPSGAPITASGYNNSGYYCGKVSVDQILDENNGKTNLETGFYKDMGSTFDANRFDLTLNWHLGEHTLSSKTGYHDYQTESRQDQSFGGGDYWQVLSYGPPSPYNPLPLRFGFLTETIGDSSEFSQELTLASPDQGALRYLLGAYYYSYESSGKERNSSTAGPVAVAPGYDTFPLVPYAKREATNWALYGQLQYDFTDALTLGVELRYNADDIKAKGGAANLNLSQTYNTVLPRVTLDWKASQNMMLYGVVSKGNKPGDFNTGTDLKDSERPVKEEDAWNYELGAKSTILDGRATLNAAVYYIDWTQQQLTTTTTGVSGRGAYSILDNLGKTDIKGFELEFAMAITDFWDLYLGYAYTDTEIKDYRISAEQSLNPSSGMVSGYEEAAQFGFPYAANGDVIISGTELPQVSKNQLTFSNAFKGQLSADWGWSARVDYLYNSKRYDQVYNAAYTGDSNRINLHLGASYRKLDMELWVRNVTNDNTSPALIRYVETRTGYYTYGPDRAIGATLPEKRATGVTVGYRF
jgi:iron complex outermembrane receptor protein